MTVADEASEARLAASIREPTPHVAGISSDTDGPQAPTDPPVRVFVSFDREHDERLYSLMLAQSRLEASGFEVVGFSDRLIETGLWDKELRQRIGEADQLIVICGEHTDSALGVFAELRIAQEERTPHFLLWGQRDLMCTKPEGAEPTESMYSWTPQVLLERLAYKRRTESGASSSNPGTAQ